MKRKWLERLRFAWPACVGLLGTLVLWFLIPIPYIVYEPGLVAATRPMVVTAGETREEEGAFLLTTVRWTYANVFKYMASLYNPDAELLEKQVITRGASRSEYIQRQSLNMQSSHGNALEAVYRMLDIPYEVKSEDIVVFGVVEGLSADGVLQTGDKLVALDGKTLMRDEDVRGAMKGKAVDDLVTVTYRRGDAELTAELALKPLPDTEPPRPGMGITYGTLHRIESVDTDYRVSIKAGSIGGPSAGLMFALQIYNAFTEPDWTRGYIIAGTGEITPDGTVGPIGGVVHKVAGAHRKGADLFFVPPGNAEAAKRKAVEIGTSMEIVTVATLKEAIDYLASIPEKATRTGGI